MTGLIPKAKVLREAIERSGNSESPAMLTRKEACKYLRISNWSLHRLIQKKELKSVKIGNRRLFRLESIVEYVKRLEAETGA